MPRTQRTEEQKIRERETQKQRRALKRKHAQEEDKPELYTRKATAEEKLQFAQKLLTINYTVPQVFEIVRKQGETGSKPYEYVTHQIVFTTAAAYYLYNEHQVLGVCQCKFMDKKCHANTWGHHWHMIVYHPTIKREQLTRRMTDVLYKRGAVTECGKTRMDPPHKRTIPIRCENHLLFVCHYTSCVTASRKNKLYERGEHLHFNLNGPMKEHIHQIKQNNNLANRRECESEIKKWETIVRPTHDYENCTCYIGKTNTEKRQRYLKMDMEERVKLLTAKLKAIENAPEGPGLADVLDIVTEPTETSEDCLEQRARNIIQRMDIRANREKLEGVLHYCSDEEEDI